MPSSTKNSFPYISLAKKYKTVLTSVQIYGIIHKNSERAYRYMLAIGQAFLQTTSMVVYRSFHRVDIFYFRRKKEKMNIYLEIFGYIGTALVILSMTMKSINKLRAFNVAGGTISTIYSIFMNAWPIVVMNLCIISINVYHLIKAIRERQKAVG